MWLSEHYMRIDSVRFTVPVFIHVVKEKLRGTVHRFLGTTMALQGTPRLRRLPPPFLAIRKDGNEWRPGL
jgi:hypothetical protein